MTDNNHKNIVDIEHLTELKNKPKTPLYIVDSTSKRLFPRLREIWEYRELLYALTVREIKIRHKQTLLGMLWSILQPLLFVLIFAFFFRNLIGVKSEEVPYPVFCFAGLLPWYFFVNALNKGMGSLVSNGGLISKIYFPRIILIIAAVISSTLDFIVTVFVLLIIMFFYDVPLHPNLVFLPLIMLWTILITFAFGLWTSVLNAYYRDIGNIVNLILQTGIFITPIAYPVSMIPKSVSYIYAINPMVGIVEAMRWVLWGHTGQFQVFIVIALLETFLVLFSGLLFFQKQQDYLVDFV